MYRETAIPKKPTTRIGEKEGKAYVGIEVIMSYRLHLCSKRYNYHLAGVFTTVNHGYLSNGSQVINLVKNATNLTTSGFIFRLKILLKKLFITLFNKLKLINKIFAVVSFVPLPSKWSIKYF